MSPDTIINELKRNKQVFQHLLFQIPEEQYRWKPSPEKWNLLEVVCHLYDEECEDFRYRTRSVLNDPSELLPPFDPKALVIEKRYSEKDYTKMLEAFLEERTASVAWLCSLNQPLWENEYQHPKLGAMSALLFLNNWLAHDLLHIRQILQLKYAYLAQSTGENLNYAGVW